MHISDRPNGRAAVVRHGDCCSSWCELQTEKHHYIKMDKCVASVTLQPPWVAPTAITKATMKYSKEICSVILSLPNTPRVILQIVIRWRRSLTRTPQTSSKKTQQIPSEASSSSMGRHFRYYLVRQTYSHTHICYTKNFWLILRERRFFMRVRWLIPISGYARRKIWRNRERNFRCIV